MSQSTWLRKTQIKALRQLQGLGLIEAETYIKAMCCESKAEFDALRHDAFIMFKPWESEAYWQEFPSCERFVTNIGWWRWPEDFRPDDGIEPHRYLFDPTGNAFDAKMCHEAELAAGADWKRDFERICYDHVVTPGITETGYINYQFRKTNGSTKSITRSRLVAYRFPHLVWRDYAKERYGLENFLAAQTVILLDVMGYDETGENFTPTGLYHPFLNDVVARSRKTGKVLTSEPKGPSGAGTKFPCVVMEIDHINHHNTDDRPANLRIADRLRNLLNSRIRDFRAHGDWLQAKYWASLRTGKLPVVKII